MKHTGFLVSACLLILVQIFDGIFNGGQSNNTPVHYAIAFLLIHIIFMLYDISDNINKIYTTKKMQEFEEHMVELTRGGELNKKLSETTEKEDK